MKNNVYELHEDKKTGAMYIFEFTSDTNTVLWSHKYTKDDLYECALDWALLYDDEKAACIWGDHYLNHYETIKHCDWVGYNNWPYSYGIDTNLLGESGKKLFDILTSYSAAKRGL